MTTSTTQKTDAEQKNLAKSSVPSTDELLKKDLPRPEPTHSLKQSGLEPVELPNDRAVPTPQPRTGGPLPSGAATTEQDTPPVSTNDPAITRPRKAGVSSPNVTPLPSRHTDVPPARKVDTEPEVPTARLTGHTLRFPPNVSLVPGHPVEVDGHTLQIKPEEAFRGMFWAKSAGIMIVTLLAAIGVAYLLSGPDSGALTGVVINARTGAIVPNAAIMLGDGRQVTTNEAGLYIFQDVKPEQYVMTASAAGFTPQNGFIEIASGETDQLSFALAPLLLADASDDLDSSTSLANQTETEASKSTKKSSSSNPSYGSVELAVDFDGYMVFVDGELYGKNAGELKRLTEGEHRVVLQLEGYEDYATTVSVHARATSKIRVKKEELTPRVDPIKRSRGHFAQGKQYLDQQEWTAAIREFNEAIDYDSEYAEAMQYRGWAYLRAENPTLAMADFTRAADIFDRSRRYLDATACAKYMIETEPKNPSHWRRRADYQLALADYKSAIEDYEEAVKLDKKSLDNRLALAEAYFAAGEYRDAAKEFDRARKLADDPSHAYIRMILSYYNAGENDDVVKKYKDFAEVAKPELLDKLRDDPEWLKVLQIIGPEERTKN